MSTVTAQVKLGDPTQHQGTQHFTVKPITSIWYNHTQLRNTVVYLSSRGHFLMRVLPTYVCHGKQTTGSDPDFAIETFTVYVYDQDYDAMKDRGVNYVFAEYAQDVVSSQARSVAKDVFIRAVENLDFELKINDRDVNWKPTKESIKDILHRDEVLTPIIDALINEDGFYNAWSECAKPPPEQKSWFTQIELSDATVNILKATTFVSDSKNTMLFDARHMDFRAFTFGEGAAVEGFQVSGADAATFLSGKKIAIAEKKRED